MLTHPHLLLKVSGKCELDVNKYPKGIQVSDEDLLKLNMKMDDFHGERYINGKQPIQFEGIGNNNKNEINLDNNKFTGVRRSAHPVLRLVGRLFSRIVSQELCQPHSAKR